MFALFRPTQNFGKLGLLFFFFFFLLKFNFSFLIKIVKINFSKCIVTVPKVNCVGTEDICALLHVSTRLLAVTYLDTENYMIYIAFLKKKKKKKIDLPTIPIFRPKGQANLYFLGLFSTTVTSASWEPGEGGYSHRNAIQGCAAQMGRFLTKNP